MASCRYPGGDWPWPYTATQRFALSSMGFRLELALRNDSDEPMPCAFGMHPYCDRTEARPGAAKTQLELQKLPGRKQAPLGEGKGEGGEKRANAGGREKGNGKARRDASPNAATPSVKVGLSLRRSGLPM